MKTTRISSPMFSFFITLTILLSGSVWGQATLPVNATFSNSTTSTISMPTGFAHLGLTGYAGALKFDTQGDVLTLNFNGTPNILNFDVGLNNVFTSGTLIPTTATFTVFESDNGILWSTAAVYTNVSCGTKSILLKITTRFVKWEYTIKPSGSNISLKNVTVSKAIEWTGSTSTDWNTAINWSPNGVPTSGNNLVIPSSGVANFPIVTNITIDAGSTLAINTGSLLTINGVLTNNGTITIEDGATLVQGASSTVSGSGTYNVKQVITGAGAATPAGRFWYLGSPVATASSSVLFASNASNVVKKRDEANNTWVTLTSGTPENLEVGRGYYLQAANGSATPGNLTLTFTGGNINNGDVTTQNLTSAGAGFTGFNLVSNPYPSYVNWATVVKNNVDGTMWYRTHNGANMDFGTVNASGIGTTVGAVQLTQYIPPMQSFWVRVSNYGQAASLTFNNASRSHFVSVNGSTAGLRTAGINPSVFIRMNLKQGEKSDQLIVYTDELSSNGLDINDAEKMMQSTSPQFYTKVGSQKTVINALNPSKKQQALPITMELPTTGVHSFVIEDLEIDNGLVWLEDKQEETIQALEPGTVYEFFANSGVNAERFILHFQLLDTPTPTNNYNEVGSYANFNGKGASVHAEAAGVVVIKLPASTEGNTDIQIRDAAGKLVYNGSTNALETSVQLAQANGIYYVNLNSASGVEVRKVFIQQ